jgi:DNA helicase-2/ATP-dependent DNA helicase PcrA
LFFLTVVRASRQKIYEAAENGQFSELEQYTKILIAVRSKFAVLKEKRGVIDFGDMLHQAIKAIDEGASVPYTHILVDEYQDCSAAQTHVLASLAKLKGRSIMVFGDPNQAIYGFGGARYTPLSEVLKKNVQQLTLPLSFRLTAQTAALASAVVQHEKEKAIQTKREGDLPVLVQDESLAGQTESIVQHIRRLIDGGTPPAQIVVLARTKALLAPIEQLLLAHNVQTSRIGTKRHHKHVLRVLKLVRIVERCESEERKCKPKMLRKALPSLKLNDSLWQKGARELIKGARIRSLEGRYGLCAKAYLQLMGGVRKDPELRADVNRWEPWSRGHDDARAMRDAILAMDTQAVVTGTIHSAKGGEWDHVLVVGVTDGLLPQYLSLDEHSLVEERNLLYVAITRARDTVRLYHAPTNHARSRQRFEKVSHFLVKRAVRKTLLIE